MKRVEWWSQWANLNFKPVEWYDENEYPNERRALRHLPNRVGNIDYRVVKRTITETIIKP
jgi:hypothetical protein